MIIVGGKYGWNQDDPNAWQCRSIYDSLGVIDLSLLQYISNYDANAGNYEVPHALSAVIGGK